MDLDLIPDTNSNPDIRGVSALINGSCEVKLEEELGVIGNNLKSLEVSEEKAKGEVTILNKRIQLLEDDLERSEEHLATAT